MLSIEGLGIFSDGCAGHSNGLGLYLPQTDFQCLAIGTANYICKPRKTTVKTAFENLQKTVKTIAARMSSAGKISVPSNLVTIAVDGDIGKITATGVQIIYTAFQHAATVPTSITYVFEDGITSEELVRRIAARAGEIDAWFKYVATNFPGAIKPQPEVVKLIEEKIVEKVIYREPVKRFRPVGALVIGAGIVTVMGLTAAAIVAGQRREKRTRSSGF